MRLEAEDAPPERAHLLGHRYALHEAGVGYRHRSLLGRNQAAVEVGEGLCHAWAVFKSGKRNTESGYHHSRLSLRERTSARNAAPSRGARGDAHGHRTYRSLSSDSGVRPSRYRHPLMNAIKSAIACGGSSRSSPSGISDRPEERNSSI